MKRAAILVAILPLLAGCGFRPLYGDPGLEPQLSAIYVEPVPDNEGYALRNTLIDLLGSDGREAGKRYHLRLLLKSTNQGVALQNDATITRYNDTLDVTWVLTGGDGKAIASGTQSSLSSYNVADSPYATQAAREDSDRRAAQDIAERIRIDLAAWFHRRDRR